MGSVVWMLATGTSKRRLLSIWTIQIWISTLLLSQWRKKVMGANSTRIWGHRSLMRYKSRKRHPKSFKTRNLTLMTLILYWKLQWAAIPLCLINHSALAASQVVGLGRTVCNSIRSRVLNLIWKEVNTTTWLMTRWAATHQSQAKETSKSQHGPPKIN